MSTNQNTENTKNEKMPKTLEELAELSRKGALILKTPIQSGEIEVKVLRFDFGKLTGFEFAEAMDSCADGKANAFRMTQKQAISLFAAAAAKEAQGIDKEDIMRRMGIEDAVKAAQLATNFFNLTSRAANMRITD